MTSLLGRTAPEEPKECYEIVHFMLKMTNFLDITQCPILIKDTTFRRMESSSTLLLSHLRTQGLAVSIADNRLGFTR
jgi:hypothetical protein